MTDENSNNVKLSAEAFSLKKRLLDIGAWIEAFGKNYKDAESHLLDDEKAVLAETIFVVTRNLTRFLMSDMNLGFLGIWSYGTETCEDV